MGAVYKQYGYPFLTNEMTGGAMAEVVEKQAEQIVEKAQQIAPVADGHYIRGLYAFTEIRDDMPGGPRVVGVAATGLDDDVPRYAAAIERRYGVMQKSMT